MYLKKWLKETELSRFWKMGIQVYSIWIYEANPKNRSDPHNIPIIGIEIWKASWFPRILFLRQPIRKYQALPNPQYYIKNSNEKREKKKKKSDSLWFRDLINPKEWFEPRERENILGLHEALQTSWDGDVGKMVEISGGGGGWWRYRRLW